MDEQFINLTLENLEHEHQREKQLALREKLLEIEMQRNAGIPDIPARDASSELRKKIMENRNVRCIFWIHLMKRSKF